MAACSSLRRVSRGAGTELCSLGTATGPEGMAWSWDRGGSGWRLGKGFAPRGWLGTGTGYSGSGHGTEPAGVQEVFGHCSQTQSRIFGWSDTWPRVRFNDPCGSLPLGCSVILIFLLKWEGILHNALEWLGIYFLGIDYF